MPTVLRVGGHSFFFYSNEGREPPHIHVRSAENYAKFWLNPVRLADSIGYNRRELRQLQGIVERRQVMLMEAWDEFFNG